MPLLIILDYMGVAVFAATVALAASRKELDLIGFLFFAAITGSGGGTVRDLILGRPVFWVVDPLYILICLATGAFVYFTAYYVESRYKLLLWLDAIGLAAYCVLGAAKGLAATGSPTIAMVTGVMTATLGGVLRDVLANEPSVLLRPEIYITSALAGAAAFTAVHGMGQPLFVSAGCGVVISFALRGGALHYGWTLPRYMSRPGRSPEEALKSGKRKKRR